MTMPKFMKLMQCACGHRVYSHDGSTVECTHCYKLIKYYG
jgi:ribosomal protein S27E